MRSFSHKNKVFSFLVFLLSPVLALYLSIKNYRATFAKNVVWGFCIVYAHFMVISNPDMDANRLRDFFLDYARQPNLTFSDFNAQLYAEGSYSTDVLLSFLMWFVSRLTDYYPAFFAVLGIIFGFFYSRNIWYLINKTSGRLHENAIIFILVFSIVIAFWHINGFRMWTAAHIFFYGTVRFFFEKDKKYVLGALLANFVHFSFILPSCVLLIFLIIGKRDRLIFIFFIGSFLFSQVSIELVRNLNLPFMPESYENKIGGYLSEEYVEKREELYSLDLNWYVTARDFLLQISIFLLFLFLYKKNYKEIARQSTYALFNFSMLFLSVANFLSSLPGAGRFKIVAYLFIFAFLFLFFQNHQPNWYKKLKPFIVGFLLLYFVVEVRNGFDTIGLRTFISPLVGFFLTDDIALIEILK